MRKRNNAKEESLDQTTKQFKVKQREGTNNWIIVMRIRADMTLSVIKNHYEVHDLLTADKYTVLMLKHIFQEEDWNIAKLGMLHNIHVAHVLKDTVTSRIRIPNTGSNYPLRSPPYVRTMRYDQWKNQNPGV
jgi:exoribonuclease II